MIKRSSGTIVPNGGSSQVTRGFETRITFPATRRRTAGCGSARRCRGRSRWRTGRGSRSRRSAVARSTLRRSGLVSRAQTSSEAGLRAPRLRNRYCSVSPESTMSSTISTCAAFDGGVEVLEDAHDAAGVGGRAVGGHGHEVDLARDLDVAHEVGQEEHGALEHADQQQVLARVVARDLGGQLADPVLELVGLDEDLADGGVAHGGSVGAVSAGRGRRRSARCPRVRARARRPPRSSAPAVASARTSSVRRAARGTAPPVAVLGQPPHDEPGERRRQGRAGGRASISVAAGERGVDDRVEHRGLLAQQLGRAQRRWPRRPGGPRAAPAAARGGRGCARRRPTRWWRPRARAGRARGSRRRSPRA